MFKDIFHTGNELKKTHMKNTNSWLMPPKRGNVDRRLILGIGHFCRGLYHEILAQISRKTELKKSILEFIIIFIKTSFFSMIEIGALHHGRPRRDIRPKCF